MYRNKVAVWPTVRKYFKSSKLHMRMEHHKGSYIGCHLVADTTTYARAHMSQCRWGNGLSRVTDVALWFSETSGDSTGEIPVL
jgi:hypothetical protein